MLDVTVYDIAREAEVSVSTVSRVLNGTAPVKASTRQKVLALIEKYQFQPNGLARSLLKKVTGTIGIVIPDINNPFFPEVFTGAENALREKGYTFFLCTTHGNFEYESQYLALLREKQVDGILFLGGRINQRHCPPDLAQELEDLNRRIPIVLVNGDLPGSSFHRVFIDEHRGAELATQHLIDLGHRHIGFIGGEPEITATTEKIAAFEQTLAVNGLSSRPEWMLLGDFSIGCGMRRMEELLALPERPTAVFCVNDFVSVGVIKTAFDHGLRIPADIAVVGFDDTVLAASTTPELTTISQRSKELGETSVRVLLQLIQKRRVRKHTVLEPVLKIRRSTVDGLNAAAGQDSQFSAPCG
ncbi:MAG: LacI family DNA-binding transcriptional regulator [Alicyclobacillaceae bacterium]|nr:LacI family DNA-binding transcriptional regulator [Alicyclobacillaceae bacterium]